MDLIFRTGQNQTKSVIKLYRQFQWGSLKTELSYDNIIAKSDLPKVETDCAKNPPRIFWKNLLAYQLRH